MSILDYPNVTCRCKENTWYYRGKEEWVCGVCHPPGDPQVVIKMRIIKGNFLINEVKWQLTQEQIDEAIGRLRDLWAQLDKPDCLYTEGHKKLKKCVPAWYGLQGIECYTCRNDYWFIREAVDEERLPIVVPLTSWNGKKLSKLSL